MGYYSKHNHLRPCIIVRYHEIALKRGNRRRFVSRLVENIKKALKGLRVSDVRALMGKIGIFYDEPIPWQDIHDRLTKVFGISNFSPAYLVSHRIEDMEESILTAIRSEGRAFKSFAINTKRGFKGFPLTSPEVNRVIGEYIRVHTSAGVDLEKPELTISIEIIPEVAFFSFDRFPGPGGIPAGISGKVCSLLSGGIDSPVATLRMMKRGCEVVFVHFHSYPYLDKTTQEKVVELTKRLTEYQFDSRLYLIPFGEIQREISVVVEPRYRVILYRRMMLRIAERIALKERAKALITGESLGQVASQTLDNLSIIEVVVSLPILRPLIGMDKDEIIDEAKRIGTFEISTMPDQDCCQLFVPRHPATRARKEDIDICESRLDIEGIVEDSLNRMEIKGFSYP